MSTMVPKPLIRKHKQKIQLFKAPNVCHSNLFNVSILVFCCITFPPNNPYNLTHNHAIYDERTEFKNLYKITVFEIYR